MIRSGKGAAIMSPGVKRLAMVFSAKSMGGNMGARYGGARIRGSKRTNEQTNKQTADVANRKFWQNYLPSLKYYNPGVEMDVLRTAEVGVLPTLTIEFGTDICSYSHAAY